MVAGIIALKESADKAPALAWLMWSYHLDLVEKHDRSRVAAAPGIRAGAGIVHSGVGPGGGRRGGKGRAAAAGLRSRSIALWKLLVSRRSHPEAVRVRSSGGATFV
jgi:hypothetical protein